MRIHKRVFPRIYIIADDLTGCSDAGVFVARHKLIGRIITHPAHLTPSSLSGFDAVIVNTDSRFLKPPAAYRRVLDVMICVKHFGMVYAFKKFDSTLRGNIGRELDAFIDALSLDRLPVVPAFPAAGRTTVRGVQYVNGVELARTHYSRDPAHPITISHLPTLLRKTARQWARMQVYDASSPDDLRKIVGHVPSSYYAGSAGVLQELISIWNIKIRRRMIHRETSLYQAPHTLYVNHDILVVSGSMHPATRAQINEIKGIRISRRGSLWIVHTPFKRVNRRTAAAHMIRDVHNVLARASCRRIILIGGDTAQRVCRSLGIAVLDIVRELEIGVVLCRANTGHEIILKPGGFGTRDTLRRCIAAL